MFLLRPSFRQAASRLVLRLSAYAMQPPRRQASFAATLMFCACNGLAAQAETAHNFRLDNGLEVVVIEDHRAPVVVQMIWYRAGAADEVPGQSGIAHFLEHLMFKGTDKVPAGQFSARVEENGGEDNAFTSWDYTAYYQRIAADRLEMVMEMEADRMRGLKLEEPVVLTERQVILEERAQRIDNDPGALLNEQMQAALFQNHRYGIPIIGWRHEIAALTRDDALAWYQKYYAPNNAVLVIAGDTTPAEVKRLAEKYYGPIAPSDSIPPRLRPQEPPQLAERRLSLRDARVADPYVYRSYLAPERNPGAQKEAAALSVLAALLGGSGQTSVLARALQFDQQIAVYSAARYDGSSIDATSFSFYVVPAPGVSLEQAETALDAALQKFLQDGPEAAAFERIKTQIRAANIYAQDDAQGLASRYGEELTIGLGLSDVESYNQILQDVSVEEVMAAAAKVLNRDAAVTGWLQRPLETSDAAAEDTAAPEAATEPDAAPIPQPDPQPAPAPAPLPTEPANPSAPDAPAKPTEEVAQ